MLLGLSSPAQSAEMMKQVGKGEGELNIVAWAGYIERGANDKAYDWVTGFEKETGCMVKEKSAGTSDEMVALMKEGGYDLVTASGDSSMRLISGGLVQPINLDLIPAYKTVDKRLQNAPWHTVDGVHYGVPYQWGWNVLMYNSKVFGNKAPNSWSVVFEEQTLPDGKSNKGRVQAYDGPIYIADAALYLKSKNPALGIKDPYSLNETQYQAAIALLKEQRKLVGRYWHDATVQVDDFTKEGVVASSSWQYQANTLQSKKFPIEIVVPKEGATGWADTTMMSANSKNPNCAYKWMQHSLNAKLQGDLASWFGSVPAVPAACKSNKLLGPDGCKSQGFNDFDKISFWKTPRANCEVNGQKCVPYSRWVTDYLAILGSK
ncbi:MAG: ABC transporter substrate-binding protein [Candidatus Pacebacteria bacterium]|nr:ABC transporter substrate-binding protein [Candidatus Paceibacterota bacterium]